PTGRREIKASMGLRDISVPMAANGIRRSWRNGGIMVVAELLCTVIATRGNKSLRVLNFISLYLFSKTFASANDVISKRAEKTVNATLSELDSFRLYAR